MAAEETAQQWRGSDAYWTRARMLVDFLRPVDTPEAVAAAERWVDGLYADREELVRLRAVDRGIANLRDQIAALEQERDRVVRLLEDLTPGGSEFVNNPDRAAAFVRDRMATSGSLAAERNRLRTLLEEMAAALIWASGSPSFAEDGEAHEGWLRLGRPVLARYAAHKAEE